MMWLLFLLCAFYLQSFVEASAYKASDVSMSVFQNRMEQMEARHTAEINKLSDKCEEAEQGLRQEIVTLRSEVAGLTKALELVEKSYQQEVLQGTEDVSKLPKTTNDQYNRKAEETPFEDVDNMMSHQQEIIAPKRALTNGPYVAFTAYLDHDLNHIGDEQVIVFNQLLLNDGNGYNQNTGSFTAPVAGVYHFNFFIGERAIQQIFTWLTVNNVNQLDAVAESVERAHDTQGGNAANLKLAQGDVVVIRHMKAVSGNHIEGSDSVRISSFSGFLLYPVEAAVVVGK